MEYLVKFNSGNTVEITQTEFNKVMYALNYGSGFAKISKEVKNESKKDYSFLLNLKNIDCITKIQKENN